jgi:hypothetical protein
MQCTGTAAVLDAGKPAGRAFLPALGVMLLLFMFAAGLHAQLTAVVPDGTDQNPPGHPLYASGWPINTYWWNQRSESIYLASDLQAAGVVPGQDITEIALLVAEPPGRDVANFRIRVRQTSATEVASFTPNSSFTLVYGPTTLPMSGFVTNQWFTFQLSTPFAWDGTSNIAIDFTTDGSGWTSGGGSRVRHAGAGRTRIGYQDSGGTWPFDNISTQRNENVVPVVRLTYDVDTVWITTPPDLPPASEGVAYTPVDITTIEGVAPLSWSLVSGSLPAGMTLTAAGDDYRLQGAPGASTGGQAYQFTVRVDDSASEWNEKQFNLVVNPPPITLPYTQDFESDDGSPDGWSTSGISAHLWEWGTPSSSGLTSGFVGSNCWGTVLGGDYGIDDAEAFLVSPRVSLAGAIRPGISFAHHVNTESPSAAWDGGTIQLRVNGGTWTTLEFDDPGFALNGPNTDDLFANGQSGWYGNPWSGWEETVIDLYELTSVSVNQGDEIEVRFWFSSDYLINNYPGWYIDYFRVRELPARNRLILTDFEVFSPYTLGSAQTPNVYTGTTADFELTVDNVTGNDIEVTGFTVRVREFTSGGTENVGTWSLTSTVPFIVPANTTGMVLTGEFDCTSLASAGSGTLLVVTALLSGEDNTAGINVETDYDADLYVSQGPPPPPPAMNVHESNFQGALIDHDQPAAGTQRDRGQVEVGGTPGGWLNIVIINDTASAFDVDTPVLGGPDAGSFQLSTAEFTSGTMTLTTTGSTRQIFFSVRLRPYEVGPLDAWVEFTHTATNPTTSPFRVNFAGEGIGSAPELQVHEGQYTGPKVDNNQAAAGTGRDFGTVAAGGFSPWQNIVLWNRFPTDTTIDPPPFLDGPDAADFELFFFPGEIQSSGAYVMDGTPTLVETTAFSVRFVPQAGGGGGPRQAFINFGHNASNPAGTVLPNGNFEFSMEVVGNVASNDPAASVSEVDAPQGNPTAVVGNGAAAVNDRDFGDRDIAQGPSPMLTIRIANPGGTTLNVGTPALVAGDTGSFRIETGAPYNTGSTLASGAYTEFGIEFNPATTGQKTATVEFTHNGTNTGSPFSFEVTGLGTTTAPMLEVREGTASGPVIDHNQSPLGTGRDFGSRGVSQGASSPVVVHIENIGTLTLDLSTPVFAASSSNPGEFEIDASGMSLTLTPGQTTTFEVMFNPVSHGPKSAFVDIGHNGANVASPFRVQLAGFGEAPRIVVREGGSNGPNIDHDSAATGGRNFGSVDLSAMPTTPLALAVVNTGSEPLTLNTPTLTGADASQFTLNVSGFASTLNPGESTAFQVSFNASQVGVKVARVNIGHNDPGEDTPFIVNLTGTGTDPAGVMITTPTLLPSGRVSVDYGPVQLEANGGQPPYFWALLPGESLPDGLTLVANGTILGVPAGPAGTHEFVVRVADNNGGTNDKLLRINIQPAPGDFGSSGSGSGGGCSGSKGQVPTLLLILAVLAALTRVTRRRYRVNTYQ